MELVCLFIIRFNETESFLPYFDNFFSSGGGEACWLDGWVLVTGVVLVTVVGLLSTLSCILALKLTSLRQQVQHKQLH